MLDRYREKPQVAYTTPLLYITPTAPYKTAYNNIKLCNTGQVSGEAPSCLYDATAIHYPTPTYKTAYNNIK